MHCDAGIESYYRPSTETGQRGTRIFVVKWTGVIYYSVAVRLQLKFLCTALEKAMLDTLLQY